MTKFTIFIALILGLISCNNEKIEIIDKPIDFSDSRKEMTLDYINNHYGINPKDIIIEPKIIVLHWTESSDFAESYSIFKPEKIEYYDIGATVANASPLNVSAQFLVDRDGSIYRLMPETWMARHTIGLNYNSIGVENVGGDDAVDNMTEAQIAANIKLVNYLAKKYPTIKYLIGHYEYTNFIGTDLWLEQDSTYRTVKTDPSEAFMTKVRAATKYLGLLKP